ncbi:DUF354 domain-containing protein [Natrialbaceae archaeon A-gly3]
MRVLFFVNTPAHAHLYKHAVSRLEAAGHDPLVLARDYGCTVDIVEYHDLPHEVYGYCGTSKGSLLARLPAHYARAIRHARRFDPDLVFGMGAYAAHTGAVVGAPVVLLIDSEATSLDHSISTPFARAVITPDTFRERLCEDHYVFSSFKECAYLHPDIYEPDPTIREELGLTADEPYVIVRLNAFGSHHDVGKDGLSPERRRRLIDSLAGEATVLVSDEGGDFEFEDVPARPFSLHPARIHDALAEASLLVADTQTMVTEAALLGTPAVRSNSFVGEADMGNFLELEERGLIYNESEFEAVLERAMGLLRADGVADTWARRRREYLETKANLTRVILETVAASGHASRVPSLHAFGNDPRDVADTPRVEGVPATQD